MHNNNNIEKQLEKLMYHIIYKLLMTITSYILYNWILDKDILLFMPKLSNYSPEEIQVKKKLGKGNIGCGIIVDLQNVFDAVEHHTFTVKPEHYDIHGITNDWFKFYLFDRKHFVFINVVVSNQPSIKYVFLTAEFLSHFYS